MIIQSKNNLHLNAPKTYLSSNVAAGATTSPAENTAALTNGWAVQFGEVGEEQSEVLIGTAASGTSITHPATAYEHPADTPIYFTKYNQVVFERSTTGTAGTATPMTNGTITYQADSPFTLFDDTSGSASYAYRTYFKNSAGVAGSTTIESDWIVITPPFYSLQQIRKRVKDKLWDVSYIQDDTVIDNWINECKDKMVNALIAVNQDYALGTIDVAFGTAGLGTITTADYKDVRRFWVTYNGQDFFNSPKHSPNDYYPDQTFSSTHPHHAWLGDNIFEVRPAESGGTARLVIYRFGTTLVNDSDELPVALRSYTDSFVNYGVALAAFKDNKMDIYDRMMVEANMGKALFIQEMSPRDKSGPTYIDIVEPLSGEDEW